VDLPTTPKGRVMADSEGRYFLPICPRANIRATRKAIPAAPTDSAAPQADTALLSAKRAAHGREAHTVEMRVIGGTVVDEAGEPAIGVTVQALVKDVVAGRRGTAPSRLRRISCRPPPPTIAACSARN
jgi:hypothetical protein